MIEYKYIKLYNPFSFTERNNYYYIFHIIILIPVDN